MCVHSAGLPGPAPTGGSSPADPPPHKELSLRNAHHCSPALLKVSSVFTHPFLRGCACWDTSLLSGGERIHLMIGDTLLICKCRGSFWTLGHQRQFFLCALPPWSQVRISSLMTSVYFSPAAKSPWPAGPGCCFPFCLVALCFIAVPRCCIILLQMEGKTLCQRKTCCVARLTLLWWPGAKPA